MNPRSRFWLLAEHSITIFVFIFLVVFTYARFFGIPYVGFTFNPSDGEVIQVFGDPSPENSLQPGDQLLKVGSISWGEYRGNARRSFVEGLKAGQVVEIQVLREGQLLALPWTLPGPNPKEFRDRLTNVWVLAYIFWLAGAATSLLVRPKDERWVLLIAFNYLTAAWLISGSISAWHVWGSAILFRVVFWFSVPVYLHLHWVFPRSLGKIPIPLIWGGYLVAFGLALLEFLQVLPRNAYHYGLILAVLGVIVLLVIRLIKQPEQRRWVWPLIVAPMTALLPAVTLSIVSVLAKYPHYFGGALLALPIIPITYFYVIYRRQLGELEVRANRIISTYIFFIVLGTLLATILPWVGKNVASRQSSALFAVVSASLTSLLAVTAYPGFERFVSRRIFGAPLPLTRLLETYASEIAASLETSRITHLLKSEILPSLMVRQSALLLLSDDGQFLPLYTSGIDLVPAPPVRIMTDLHNQEGKYLPSPPHPGDLQWLRIFFSLHTNGKLLGYWLLGRKDPDDFYSQPEISLLRAVANQTAIALVNAAQAERLRLYYQANIERHEEERTSLARELHDQVLNQLAALSMNTDLVSDPAFSEKYQLVMSQLRRMVSNLRPATLVFGLREALEELIDDLANRVGEQMMISMEIPPSAARYDPKVEEHLYRIVQQACENAVRHAHAQTICVSGLLEPNRAEILVEDDGVGMPGQGALDFNALLAKKHFGLAGMFERAGLIGAVIQIESAEKAGTKIKIIWSAQESFEAASRMI